MESLTQLAERERALAARLAPLRQICQSLAFSVLIWAGLIWFFVEGETFHAIPGLPPELPLSLTVAASIVGMVKRFAGDLPCHRCGGKAHAGELRAWCPSDRPCRRRHARAG